jgi:mono/diheme cytochrome c family protein
MPAFGGRLNQTEIDNVAEYVIISAESNFEN